MIVLGEHDVRELLDMESCIDAMQDVLTSLRHHLDRTAGRFSPGATS